MGHAVKMTTAVSAMNLLLVRQLQDGLGIASHDISKETLLVVGERKSRLVP